MKYDNKSEYAINKVTDDIVYRFADGTGKRYCKENGKVYQIITNAESTEMIELPLWKMSVEEFDRMKAISNSDYHERELHGKRTTRDDVPIGKLAEASFVAARSTEEEYFGNLEDHDSPPDIRTMENAKRILEICLTNIQRRRYWEYHFHGKTVREIADEEGTFRNAIWKSIQLSEKKIKRFLENQQKGCAKRHFFGDR